MRPRVKPVLRRVDRDERTLQFGVHPRRAVVLTDLEPAVRALIESLDGTRTLPQVIAHSELDEASVREMIALLEARGVVEDASVRPDALTSMSMPERDRLRPDLDRLSLTSSDGGMGTLALRRAAQIRVYGAGRVGAQIAVLLAAAGIGHLCVVDSGTARRQDVVPGGLGWPEVGMSREAGTVAVAGRIAPGVNAWTGRTASRLGDGASRPGLVILAPVKPLDGLLVRELNLHEIPHLLVTAFEGWGSVGPLVIPGVTPCLDCLDLTRRDRDPAWPMVSARLGGFPVGEIACDTVLSTLVAAEAVGHALAFTDGRGSIVRNGTLEISPGGRRRRRSWERHPQCRCGRNERRSLRMVA